MSWGWFHRWFRWAEITHTVAAIWLFIVSPPAFAIALLGVAAAMVRDWGEAEWPVMARDAVAFACVAVVLFALTRTLLARINGEKLRSHAVAVKPPPAPGPHYLSVREVIEYLANEAEWGALKAVERTSDGLYKNVMLEAPLEFQARAAEGRIRAYGISPVTHEHEEIPAVHWLSFGFEYTAVFREDGEGRTEHKGAHGGYYDKPGYSGLRIVAADVYSTWPRRSV